jgi:2-oxoisovalerate dehydrogenase E1 component
MTQTTPQLSVDLYRDMLRVRRFEERVLELRRADEVAGSVHPALGQEAVPVGALAALEPDDQVIATYRGHGWALASGVPAHAVLAEICGRATGTNGGRGGSPYLSAPEHRFLGENSIVGAGLPIADGVALAAQVLDTGRVVVVSFGDGATNQGAAHEALVLAVARRLPVIFLCENNRWSEMTPISAMVPGGLAERVAGYGIAVAEIDGGDPVVVRDAVAEAAVRARQGEGPTFIEAHVVRLAGHYNADVEQYRPAEDREAAQALDPVPALRAALLAGGQAASELEEVEARIDAELEAIVAQVLADPRPDPATARDHVTAAAAPLEAAGRLGVAAEPAGAERLTYAKAINSALARELGDRPEVVVFGEDVAIPGGVFGVTRELQERFGAARVFDTPIAEASILGSAVGASMCGLRPVAEVMWADFLFVALDQLVNQAANVRYLHRGAVSAPLVVRCQQGVTPGSCAQHSQSVEALLAHIPGLRVGMPATPQDGFAMLRAAVAGDDPTIIIESRALYGRKGPVALDAPVEAVGGARLRREGSDVTIVTWGPMQDHALTAADALAGQGIDAGVLDLRWLSPLDEAAIAEQIVKTNRVVVAHEANVTGGFGAEVVAGIVDRHFDDLDAPPVRVGSPDVRFPSSPVLQQALLPEADDLVRAVRGLFGEEA